MIQDEFNIYSISTADDLHLLQITDTENQKFNAVITDSNVFFIQKVISHLITAAARKHSTTDKTVKLFSSAQFVKIKLTDVNNFNNSTKSKQKNYNKIWTMKIWHHYLAHLNTADIIKLSEDLKSDILIKNSKILFFCKTCHLANMKKKSLESQCLISNIMMRCFILTSAVIIRFLMILTILHHHFQMSNISF